MKVGYILYPEALVINKANGIRNQAITWAKSLESFCEVDLLSPWDSIEWDKYDLIHVFGGNQWLGFIPDLKALNDRIVFSPILDSVENQTKLKLQANLGFKGYHHPQSIYKQYVNNFTAIFVRSEYEGSYYRNCYGIADDKIIKVPISYDFNKEEINRDLDNRQNFCLHISALYQPRKNVLRLIEAAKRFGFQLKLGGSTGNEDQTLQLKKVIGNAKNIELLGYISKTEAIDLYSKASVFALPSINEGVGIVALNAASLGCNIVITSIGGPKEYFGDFASVVNPFDVEEIGSAIMKYIMNDKPNLVLRNHVINNYSEDIVAGLLFESYKRICRSQ